MLGATHPGDLSADSRIVTLRSRPNPFDLSTQVVRFVEVDSVATLSTIVDRVGLGSQVVVVHNGQVAHQLQTRVLPGDVVNIYPYLGGGGDGGKNPIAMVAMVAVMVIAVAMQQYWVPGMLASSVAAGTMTAATAGFIGVAAGMATMALGGLLINAFLPPDKPSMSDDAGSPTYGWGGNYNPYRPGIPLPVGFGEFVCSPALIGQYVTVDDDSYMWFYGLYAISDGRADNLPTAADVLVGGEPLTNTEFYTLGATYGGDDLTAGDIAAIEEHFSHIHQYRYLSDNVLKCSGVPDYGPLTLLHLNGDVVDATGTFEFSVTAGTSFDSTNKKFGSASFVTEYPYGDPLVSHYIYSEEARVLDLLGYGTFTMDFWFRPDTVGDHGIACGRWTMSYNNAAGGWSLRILDGKIGFCFDRRGSASEHVYDYKDTVEAPVTYSANTWNHVRVVGYNNEIKIYFNGACVAYEWTQLNTYTWEHVTNDPLVFDFCCRIGNAYVLTDDPDEIHSDIGMSGNIDEFYVYDGLISDFSLGTIVPPTQEWGDDEFVLPANTPYIQTRGSVDRMIFTIEFPLGLIYRDDQGKTYERTIYLRGFYRVTGTETWTGFSISVTDESQYAVRRQFTVDVTRGKYDVAVVRLTTDDDEGSTSMSKSYWTGLDEIIKETLHYPNTQCLSLGIRASDKASGPPPAIQVAFRRYSVDVPNFNGVGTMSVDRRNPTWACYDLLTNPVTGWGVDPAQRLLPCQAQWEAWGDWCDELVEGEPRCRFNGIWDTHGTVESRLTAIAMIGRAIVIPYGWQFLPVVDRPWSGSPVNVFSRGNIKPGSYSLTYLPMIDRVDEVQLNFKDRDNQWRDANVFARCSDFETLDRVIKSQSYDLIGINNTPQATREAILRSQRTEYVKRSLTFRVDVDALGGMPGQVVAVQPNNGVLSSGGRIISQTSNNRLRLSEPVTLEASMFNPGGVSNARMWLRTNADDNVHELTITGPFDEETQEVDLSSSIITAEHDVYCIGRISQDSWLYRIMNYRMSSEQEVEIMALEYVDGSYYHPDYGSGAVPI